MPPVGDKVQLQILTTDRKITELYYWHFGKFKASISGQTFINLLNLETSCNVMKFTDVVKRITGISTPIFGISWNPENTERDIARQVLSYLEDRRVLYVPSEMECPDHCVKSVLQMRQFLTSKIGKVPETSELSKSLRSMRAACRKFLSQVDDPFRDIIKFGAHVGHFASWEFNGALGELRGVFGIHIARIAVAYGIDIEEDLASIVPEEDTD